MIVIAFFADNTYKKFEDVILINKEVATINDKLTDVIRLFYKYKKGGDTFFPVSCLYSVTED